MLSDRSDELEDTTIDDAGDSRCGAAWMRALGLDALTHEDLQASCDAVQAVALGHFAQPPSFDDSSRTALKIASENVG